MKTRKQKEEKINMNDFISNQIAFNTSYKSDFINSIKDYKTIAINTKKDK